MNTTERLTDRKRCDIVAAAVAAFSELGFDNTSMDLVAQRASVSKRTVYNHFPSKDLLFEAIVKGLKESAVAATKLPYSRETSLASQLEKYFLDVIAFHCHPCSRKLARVLVSRFIRTPELGQEMLGKSKVFETSLIDWLVSAQRDDRLYVSDPAFAARQVLAMVEGFCVWPQLLLDEPNPNETECLAIAKSAVQVFLKTYEDVHSPSSQSSE